MCEQSRERHTLRRSRSVIGNLTGARLADDSNSLGDLSVNITGDMSELEDALDGAQTVATQAASDIGDALQSVADASGLAGGDLALFQSVLEQDQAAGIALTQSLTDLSESAATVGQTVADAAASALEHLQATQDLGQASGEAASQVKELSEAASESASSAEEAESGWQHLGETLLELGGVALTVEGMKELAEEALGAYASVEKATLALTALT